MTQEYLRILFIAIGLLAMSLSSGCAGGDDGTFSLVRADVARNESPSVATADLSPLVEGNSTFAIDLYRLLSEQDGNLFFSPHSISVALAMTYAGAASDTATEMAETLHFDLPRDELHLAFNRLDLELAARSEVETENDEAEPFELSIANSIWAEQVYEFLDPFLATLASNYGAGARLVDFINESETARSSINAWVSDETNERILELIPQGVINTMTRLVLTNAVYFKASWVEPFAEELTEEGEFHLLTGSTVRPEMMRSGKSLQLMYMEGDGFQAVELPYVGDQMAMLVILPESGEFPEFEEDFDQSDFAEIVASLQSEAVTVVLPRFAFSSDLPLKQALAVLGMPTAFEPGAADFSGMDGSRSLFVQDVLHKAFVAVDEYGTEAAAATAVVVGVTSAPAEPKHFEADRPFLFLIRDRVTGTILFAGRVLDPTA